MWFDHTARPIDDVSAHKYYVICAHAVNEKLCMLMSHSVWRQVTEFQERVILLSSVLFFRYSSQQSCTHVYNDCELLCDWFKSHNNHRYRYCCYCFKCPRATDAHANTTGSMYSKFGLGSPMIPEELLPNSVQR